MQLLLTYLDKCECLKVMQQIKIKFYTEELTCNINNSELLVGSAILNQPSNKQMQTKCKNLATASKNIHSVHALILFKYQIGRKSILV